MTDIISLAETGLSRVASLTFLPTFFLHSIPNNIAADNGAQRKKTVAQMFLLVCPLVNPGDPASSDNTSN
jgi:hypothetical protein